MDAHADNRNLAFEVLSLLLFLVALSFLLVVVLATALYLGTEILPELALTEEEKARMGPYGFQIAVASLLLFPAMIGLWLLGIRLFLVRRPGSDEADG